MPGRFGPRLQHYEERDCGHDTPCWIWLLCKQKNGYGKGMLYGKYGLAHRLYYERIRGPIPEGLVIDHLCRQRACVNPDHMEPVTTRENLRRGAGFPGVNARKTECPQGHPLSGPNLMVIMDRRGRSSRRCRTCDRQRTTEWIARQAAS